ncbi:MAG: hypothetical protein Q9166_006861 [cf. Caloplaca sp. 2 TL-2023]
MPQGRDIRSHLFLEHNSRPIELVYGAASTHRPVRRIHRGGHPVADFQRNMFEILDGNAIAHGALLGPTVREIRPRDKNLPGLRYVEESDGYEYPYKYVKNIGVGGQGHCDLYRRQGSSKLLVCKVMKHGFDLARDAHGKRKPAEAILLKDILSPHRFIVNLHSFSTTTFWFEFCSGGDLQDLCDAYIAHFAQVPESFIWHAYAQLAEAFCYIHMGKGNGPEMVGETRVTLKKGWMPIIHRDVKPSNIFLRPNPRSRTGYPDLVLADFGIATTKLDEGDDYVIGTPMYQPPEVPVHSRQGDIWSLGACIHVLATGSPPMGAKPKGWDMRDWYEAREARMVADLRSLGYSHNLHAAQLWTLRMRPEDRLMGSGLVGKVSRAWYDFEHEQRVEPLARWALKG